MDGTVMIRTVIKHYLIGMSSAFDLFPANEKKLPFKVSIEDDGFAKDKEALCNDMNKIGDDFQVAISKITENE